MVTRKFLHVALFFLLWNSACAYNVSDDILYDITWKAQSSEELIKDIPVISIPIVSKEKNSYSCTTSPLSSHHSIEDSTVTPNELYLLGKLFDASPCIYRVEGYWTYELCHTRYIRQYREEPVSQAKTLIVKEYYLGYRSDSADDRQYSFTTRDIGMITVAGKRFPHYQLNFTDGSECDLTGQKRFSLVSYVCVEDSTGDLFQIAEVESCIYQIVVFTDTLCSSPTYRLQNKPSTPIVCSPTHASTPIKPPQLIDFEQERDRLSESGFTSLEGIFGDLKIKGIKIEKDVKQGVVLYKLRTDDEVPTQKELSEAVAKLRNPATAERVVGSSSVPSDGHSQSPHLGMPDADLRNARASTVESFLAGKKCLTGGFGWWTHELCYGTTVLQFHEDAESGKRNEILLGTWNLLKHKNWLQQHPTLRPELDSAKRISVSHYYGDGAFCDSINGPRSVVVSLSCSTRLSAALQLSFSEPKTCHYSLKVESAFFCNAIQHADMNGFLPNF